METQELETELLTNHEPQSNALTQLTRAQYNIEIETAKKYPRTLSKVKSDMMSFATLDEETATACFYTLPRGGKTIQGASVRLAEIAITCYGNVRVGTRILETVADGDHPHVIVQAVAHDLERNVGVTIEKRRRITQKKSKNAPDEDDINLATNACSSIAYRDAAFKVVPMALIKPVLEAAKKVAVGDIKSLVVQRTKVLERLKQMGATEDRILAVVNARKVEDIDADKLGELIGLGTALKDGATTLEEAFPPIAPIPGPKFASSFLDPKAAQPAPETQPETVNVEKP